MNKIVLFYIGIFLFANGLKPCLAQNSQQEGMAGLLDSLASENPRLEKKVDLNVRSMSAGDFIAALGKRSQVNVSIAQEVDFRLSHNFNQAKVRDILLFLCVNYDLAIQPTGNILHLYPVPEPFQTPRPKSTIETLPGGRVNFSSRYDSVINVVHLISDSTQINLLLGHDVDLGLSINAELNDISPRALVEMLCSAHGLALDSMGHNFILRKQAAKESLSQRRENPGRGQKGHGLNITGDTTGFFISVENMAISDLIGSTCRHLGIGYHLSQSIAVPTTIHGSFDSFDTFLSTILFGSGYDFTKSQQMVYNIYPTTSAGIAIQKIYRLKYRSVEGIVQIIPASLTKEVEILESKEVNGLILSGYFKNVASLYEFLESVDVVIPVIAIEVIIIDFSESDLTSLGAEAGFLGPGETVTPGGTVFPGIDFTADATIVNGIISSLNGFGAINLGTVSDDFYLTLRALEEKGILDIRSTPSISTLNGYPAELTIGQTEYYLQIRNDLLGTQNPALSTQETWQSVEASLTISISPIVSKDGQVTLEINVNQSSFTPRITQTAPPGMLTKEFDSKIRIKDGEVILLGGLETISSSETRKGLPFINRVPVLNYLFSSRDLEQANSKLSVFIRPTIIY